jgi:hypothetical protein
LFPSSDLVAWLLSCIDVILGLLNLFLFSWRASDAPSGCFRTSTLEPWVFTWTKSALGEWVVAEACIGYSPRESVSELCRAVLSACERGVIGGSGTSQLL